MSASVPVSPASPLSLGGTFTASISGASEPGSDGGLVGGKPDPGLVAEMKHEIRVLVQEVAEHSKSNVQPDDFYAAFLPRVVSAMAAVGGAVWTVGETNRLRCAYQ